jgi:hypothetical protein
MKIVTLLILLFSALDILQPNTQSSLNVCGRDIEIDSYYFECINGHRFNHRGLLWIRHMSKVEKIYLENLHINRNLAEIIFFYIKNNKQIKEIILINTTIKEIPFEKLKGISVLIIEKSPIENINKINEIINPTEILLSDTKIENIKSLKKSFNLTSLILSNNQISDISPLKGMRIKSLLLQERKVKNISPIGHIKELNSLTIFDLDIHNLDPLKENRSIEHLYISNIHLDDLSVLSGWNQLKTLKLERLSNIGLQPIKRLNNLQTLSLVDISIKDLSPLYKMTWLKEIDLTGATYPKGQLEALRVALPTTKITIK